MRKLLWLSSLILAASGCVTVSNTRVCSVAGQAQYGAICAETLTSKTYDLTFDQLIDMLEAQPERPDPDHPGQVLPAHGAAIIQSSEDWGKNKTALEEACRELGARCSYEVKQAIVNLNRATEKLRR